MRFAPVIIMATLLAALPVLAFAKPPEGITVNVEVGYNGVVHPARTNPVIVEMDNQSAGTNLSGDLILEYNGYEYATKLDLPTPSKKRFFLYFPCDNYPPGLTLRFRSKGWSEAIDLTRSYKPMRPEDVSVVVLSRQGGSLGMVNQQDIVQLSRNLYTDVNSTLSGGKVYVSYFRIDEVDYNPKFFGRADTVIIGDIDYQQVTPELAEAIKACAAGGASVVFSLGRNGAGLAASPLADICPLRPTGTVQLTDLGDFGRLYGIAAPDAPAMLATGGVGEGATVAAWSGPHPVIASRSLGSGKVTALAFDFEDVPFKQNPALAAVFFDHALGIEENVSVRNWFIHPQTVSLILKRLGEANPISPSFVFMFLFAYILLVGPLNFLILGRMKRSTLVWTTIPLLVLGFTALGIYTGRLTRGADNVTAYFQELHVYPGAAYTPYQTTMLVFTAERSSYELRVPDRSAIFNPRVPEVIDPLMAQMGGVRSGGLRGFTHGTVDNSAEPVAKVSQSKWQSEVYFYQGNLGFPQQTTADLTAVRREGRLEDLSGTFSLDLPFDLHNCYITAPFVGGSSSNHREVGNLRGKGSYDIATLTENFQGQLDPENYLVQNLTELVQSQRASAQLGLTYRDEVLLVGFTEDMEAMAEFDAPHVEHRLNQVVVHLPYRAILPQDGPAEISRQRLVAGSGFRVDSYSGHFAGFDRQQYAFKKDGFVEVAFEIVGDVSSESALHVRLAGHDTSSGFDIVDFSKLTEISILEGDRWVPLRIPPRETVLRVPLAGRLASDRSARLRMVALADSVLSMPTASMPR